MPTKKKDPNAPVRPTKVAGWLECDECGQTLAFTSFGKGEALDGPDGWPRHRCSPPEHRISKVRPFTRWSKTNVAALPPSPLEGP